jgi:hypothetical protein
VGRSIVEIAEAFSRHRFTETYAYLMDDIRWSIVGDRHIAGRDHVIETCEQSATFLAGVVTTFAKFKIVAGDSCVVIDTEAKYVDGDGESSVIASCDIYDFSGGRLAGITSYTVELNESA